jgi:hypothetical protein
LARLGDWFLKYSFIFFPLVSALELFTATAHKPFSQSVNKDHLHNPTEKKGIAQHASQKKFYLSPTYSAK